MIKIILILVFCFPAFAQRGNWVAETQIKDEAAPNYREKSVCQALSGAECFERSGKDLRRWMKGQVDDLARPKYQKKDSQSCIDEATCQPLFAALDCTQYQSMAGPDGPDQYKPFAVKLADLTEVYCAEPYAYEQMDDLIPDSAGIIAADAEDATKAVLAAQELNIKAVKTAMECGRDVLALMAIRNAPKSLTRPQKKTLISTYSDAKNFLELGSLQEARDEVDEATPDGTIVTQADKDAILAKIDDCLGQ